MMYKEWLGYDLSMERVIATISDNGELILPAAIPAALGLEAGTEVEVVLNHNIIELKKRRVPLSVEEFNLRLREMQKTFAGGPSLEDELYKMRREEEEHFRRKYGC